VALQATPDIFDSFSKWATFLIIPAIPIMLYWFSKRSKNKGDSNANQQYVEGLAREVKEKADQLAITLKEMDQKVAMTVRTSIENFVNAALDRQSTDYNNKINKVQDSSDHKVEMIYAELKNMNTIITDIIKDVVGISGNQGRGTDKLERKLEMLEQFTYGTKTKSDSPLLEDKEETQEHKDKVGDGIFKPTEEEQDEIDAGDVTTQDEVKKEEPK
jgi:hypothetical protein